MKRFRRAKTPARPVMPPAEASPKPVPASREGDGRLLSIPGTGEPLEPRAQPGYYPGFSTLAQQDFWDEATRALVLKRVHDVPEVRFFSPAEEPIARAVFDRVLPQDDRDDTHKIPVLNYVDARLYERHLDGYRFEGAPEAPEAHRLGLRAIEAIARHLHGASFTALGVHDQEEILLSIRDERPAAGHEIWRDLPVGHYWQTLVQDVVEAYYAHPYAWDEIGFGGPAYPRGYMRLENGRAEPWEVDERRYAWREPAGSLSGTYRPLKGLISGEQSGQGGPSRDET